MRWRIRPRVRALGAALAGLAILALSWWLVPREGHAERVGRVVRTGVPLGSSRAEAEAWVQQACGVIPTYHADVTANRIQGRTIPECAGAAANELGGLVCFSVRPDGLVARILDRVRPDHVWVYFLLDKDQRVQDYYFFSFNELRELERQKAAQRP